MVKKPIERVNDRLGSSILTYSKEKKESSIDAFSGNLHVSIQCTAQHVIVDATWQILSCELVVPT